jgi:hypothetical protein
MCSTADMILADAITIAPNLCFCSASDVNNQLNVGVVVVVGPTSNRHILVCHANVLYKFVNVYL